jgi:hypothetical protein
MSLFTQIRNFVEAPLKSTAAMDPLLHKLTTGHFNMSVRGYKQRVAAGVHEMYSQDRLAQKLGIKESSIVNVVAIAGVVVAVYFTAGAASGAFGGTGAGAGASAGGAAGSGLTAGEAFSAASALKSVYQATQDKKAAQAAADKAAQAQALQAQADKNAAIVASGAAPASGFTLKHILTMLAIAAAVL